MPPILATIRTTATRSPILSIRCPNCCLIKQSLIRGLAAECQKTRSASISGNGPRNWLFNIFQQRCCVIIATTRRWGNRIPTARSRPTCQLIPWRNSRRIIFGPGWMTKLRLWAAVIMSLIPDSQDHNSRSVLHQATLRSPTGAKSTRHFAFGT